MEGVMTFSVEFFEVASAFDYELVLEEQLFGVEFANYIDSGGQYEFYEGAYTVVPSVESQVIMTRGKMMKDDIQVAKIPYVEVTNTANGLTVTIAE